MVGSLLPEFWLREQRNIHEVTCCAALKPNSITLASSELAPNMFGAGSELAPNQLV